MRIANDDNFKVDKEKNYIGFVGDSFVYGSGIDYKDHFISKLDNKKNLVISFKSWLYIIFFIEIYLIISI